MFSNRSVVATQCLGRSGATDNHHQVTRRLALLGAAAAGCALEVAGQSALASALTSRGNRLFVRARVNGHPVEALLDSAAESSLIDPRAAARFGLGEGERQVLRGSGAATMDARTVPHVALEAAGVRVADATVAVADLSDISRRLVGRPVAVILGREIFDAAPLFIDIEAGVIRRLGPGEPRRGVALPLSEARGVEHMPASVEGRAPVLAEFDLGNGSNILVGRAYARSAGLLQNRPAVMVEGGGLGGARPRERIMLGTLTLAGRSFRDVPAEIDDSDNASDLNIGVGILRHFRIVSDFPARRVWLDYAA